MRERKEGRGKEEEKEGGKFSNLEKRLREAKQIGEDKVFIWMAFPN